MKFPILATILLAISLFTGCSKKLAPDVAYAMLKKREIVNQSQLAELDPSDIIIPGIEKKYKLSLTDSVSVFGGSLNILSNFRLFYLDTRPNTTYRITVKGYCNCFGFTKQIFQPVIQIFNGSEPLRWEPNKGSYDATDRLVFFESYIFKNQGDNTRLVVFSNNQDINKIAYTFDIFFIKTHVRNTTGGDFSVLLEEVK
ncbi:hypothetical protein GR160_11705 [Flavobacterium sp. Sd200]|uniref:hypothetical protein n=1 Tax=Flavobacterium sp. Sd200 TaxID=2692211 RepID=UPI0013711301|nr:hypothetical protein [Flavobacterium sp. Sd200]MXN91888.1 hypothetical protein [Flavobacterium sp. Sd200]